MIDCNFYCYIIEGHPGVVHGAWAGAIGPHTIMLHRAPKILSTTLVQRIWHTKDGAICLEGGGGGKCPTLETAMGMKCWHVCYVVYNPHESGHYFLSCLIFQCPWICIFMKLLGIGYFYNPTGFNSKLKVPLFKNSCIDPSSPLFALISV